MTGYAKQWSTKAPLEVMQKQAVLTLKMLQEEHDDFEERFYLRFGDKRGLAVSGKCIGSNKL